MGRTSFIASIEKAVLADAVKKGVLPSLTMAQAILESADGKSELSYKYNNYFGIKGSGTGGSVSYPTKEYSGGKWITINAPFAAYNSIEEGIADHTSLFSRVKLGNGLRYQKVLDAKNYIEAAKAVKDCGYATDPNYTQLIIDIIEGNNLQRLDALYSKAREVKKMPTITVEMANEMIARFCTFEYDKFSAAEKIVRHNYANALRRASGQVEQ